jgi:hypothetical protein
MLCVVNLSVMKHTICNYYVSVYSVLAMVFCKHTRIQLPIPRKKMRIPHTGTPRYIQYLCSEGCPWNSNLHKPNCFPERNNVISRGWLLEILFKLTSLVWKKCIWNYIKAKLNRTILVNLNWDKYFICLLNPDERSQVCLSKYSHKINISVHHTYHTQLRNSSLHLSYHEDWDLVWFQASAAV